MATQKMLDDAFERLQKLASVGAPFAARSGAEARYAEIYQQLVQEGKKQQISSKYRRGNVGKRMGGGHNNGGSSQGKHLGHPDVPGFRRKGYKVESKWNPKETAAKDAAAKAASA